MHSLTSRSLLSPNIFFVLVTRVIGSLQVFDLIYMVIDKSNPALTKTQSLVYLFYKYAFINKNMGYGATIVSSTSYYHHDPDSIPDDRSEEMGILQLKRGINHG